MSKMKGIADRFLGPVAAFALAVSFGGVQAAEDRIVTEPTTASIQAAVDEAHAAGGGRIVIPPGTWDVGTIVLKSNVELHLSKGAVLKATRRNREIRQIPDLPGHKASHGLVIAWYAENIALTGEGELNGDGLDYFEHDKPADCWGRFFYRRSPSVGDAVQRLQVQGREAGGCHAQGLVELDGTHPHVRGRRDQPREVPERRPLDQFRRT